MAEYDAETPTYDVSADNDASAYDASPSDNMKRGVSAAEASVAGLYPKAGWPWPTLCTRSEPLCPPPKVFWDFKYGLPLTLNILIFLMIMIAIPTTKPEITCAGSTEEIEADDYKVQFLLDMSIVMFLGSLIILSLNYFIGIPKLLVISMGANNGMQQILNWWMLQLSFQVVCSILIFIAAIVVAAATKKKQDDVDKAVSGANSNCNDDEYNVDGYVFAYSVAFIWFFSLNLWQIYVYYKACKSQYGMPCGGGSSKSPSSYTTAENVHAV